MSPRNDARHQRIEARPEAGVTRGCVAPEQPHRPFGRVARRLTRRRGRRSCGRPRARTGLGARHGRPPSRTSTHEHARAARRRLHTERVGDRTSRSRRRRSRRLHPAHRASAARVARSTSSASSTFSSSAPRAVDRATDRVTGGSTRAEVVGRGKPVRIRRALPNTGVVARLRRASRSITSSSSDPAHA